MPTQIEKQEAKEANHQFEDTTDSSDHVEYVEDSSSVFGDDFWKVISWNVEKLSFLCINELWLLNFFL